jgi:hypothetical protein
MDGTVADRLKQAHHEHPDAVFTVFTISGHVISGRITLSGKLVTLDAGKEMAVVPDDRIEAFSMREA